jgi:hypothetical protein
MNANDVQVILSSTWTELDKNVLILIAQFLCRLEEFINFSAVCCDWNRIYKSTQSLCSSYLCYAPAERTELLSTARSMSAEELETKYTENITAHNKTQHPLYNLYCLDLSNCEDFIDSDLGILVHSFPKLRSIIFNNNNQLSSRSTLYYQSSVWKHQLTSISYNNCSCIDDEGFISMSELTHLTHLSLTNNNSITDAAMYHLTNNSPLLKSLTSLNLSHCQTLSDKSVSFISKFIHLTQLNMRATNITHKATHFVNKLINLTDLDLTCCRHVDDFAVMKLNNSIKIAYLALGDGVWHNKCISSLSIYSISANFPRIKQLVLAGCRIINQDLEKVSLMCRELQSLDISSCAEVNCEGFLHIVNMPALVRLEARGLIQLNDSFANISSENDAINCSLQYLDVSACLQLGSLAVWRLVSLFPGLHSLLLNHCPRVDDAVLPHIFSLQASLVNMALQYTGITDIFVLALPRFKKLKKLHCQGCNQLSQKGLLTLLYQQNSHLEVEL